MLDHIQNDLKLLSIESKKKFPLIKESAEEAQLTLRNGLATKATIAQMSSQILFPLVQGCETKDPKIVHMCLSTIQKLILAKGVDKKGGEHIIDCLWLLMENGVEEVKLLQTATLLVTSGLTVQGYTLAKCLVLCFRLHFTKDPTTSHTAAATVQQLISHVFERVVVEDGKFEDKSGSMSDNDLETLKSVSEHPPTGLRPSAADAFLLFQDLILLINGERPHWLRGLNEMTRTFGLELIESILTDFASVFSVHPEFAFLLKERVCALVIKLFSPNVKFRLQTNPALMSPQSQPDRGWSAGSAGTLDKPHFPVAMRLLRLVSVLVTKYYELLATQCEIFLSLIMKFLDPDKPAWQRALALEVLHKLVVQPQLLKVFCAQGLSSPSQSVVGSLIASGQPGFLFRGVCLPVGKGLISSQPKALFLEMLDKTDSPQNIAEGYGITLAFGCLMETVRSLNAVIGGDYISSPIDTEKSGSHSSQTQLQIQLIKSSSAGLLSALQFLLRASVDDALTEQILQAMQQYAWMCGTSGVNDTRDDFVRAICRSCFPPSYNLSVLMCPGSPKALQRVTRTSSVPGILSPSDGSLSAAGTDGEPQQQVVAVGPPLNTTALIGSVSQSGPVMLTAKNLLCMKGVLSFANAHGKILDNAWHVVLTTLQHLVWILGLKPTTSASARSTNMVPGNISGQTLFSESVHPTNATNVGMGGVVMSAASVSGNEPVPSSHVTNAVGTNAVLTTAVLADIPVLSSMLNQLFESSRNLDEVALHHFIDALCKLSEEAMEMVSQSNREPSLFAAAKLLETGIVNLSRVQILWRPVTSHLLEVSAHAHPKMRDFGVEAVTHLVQNALQFPYNPPLKENQELQTILLAPLLQLPSDMHPDVRQKQLEAVLQILHSSGESLHHAWPTLLTIVGSIRESHSENLVRTAFQCLHLVVNDFLTVMPVTCLPICVDTVAKFGNQTQELNISLTAIGLIWNISDHFSQNRTKLENSLSEKDILLPAFPDVPYMPPLDKLWMRIYAQLGDLCVDSRPAVRKSASQTLFSTISAHGHFLKPETWRIMILQVLFPLLERVSDTLDSASCDKVEIEGGSKSILIHHSRNTAQKQWAETQVMSLSGVARVFFSKRDVLFSQSKSSDFVTAWSRLLGFIEKAAFHHDSEVSLSALKAFHEIVMIKSMAGKDEKKEDNPAVAKFDADYIVSPEGRVAWKEAWDVWCRIGLLATGPICPQKPYQPTQSFLTALMLIFKALFQLVREDFSEKDLQCLCEVIGQVLTMPTSASGEDMLSLLEPNSLTPLQDAILNGLQPVTEEVMSSDRLKSMLPRLHEELLRFAAVGYSESVRGQGEGSNTANVVVFSERVLLLELELYKKTAQEPSVINGQILVKIVEWVCRLRENFMELVLERFLPKCGISSANAFMTTFLRQVSLLLFTLHSLFFVAFSHIPGLWGICSVPPGDYSADNASLDEEMDCKVIEVLRDAILSHPTFVPRSFLLSVMLLLNKGSIHSAQSLAELESGRPLREKFAKACFDTLLEFSLIHHREGSGDSLPEDLERGIRAGEGKGDPCGSSSVTSRVAVASLVERFREILTEHLQELRQKGRRPLTKQRVAEVSFVLRSVSTLIASLRKLKRREATWNQLIGLYPLLVECIPASSCSQISEPLQEALQQYKDLLRPPNVSASPTSSGLSLRGVSLFNGL
ncbi:unnamed protein product [Notodromas monacha]|uniref:Protein MON2 homolog n=1 Tax=Notodromas monacha TaxID=399045 RepID=A0A7R9BGQ8_9CRUS|nr:unnamed protein product [Notodromas monacha]CAG0915150.1 unnamed protein product [Notodromas monacha]